MPHPDAEGKERIFSCSAARPSPSHTFLARKRSRSTQERRIDVFVSRARAFAPWPFAYTIYILHFAASCVATRDQQISIRHGSLRFLWYTAYRVYTASHGGAVLLEGVRISLVLSLALYAAWGPPATHVAALRSCSYFALFHALFEESPRVLRACRRTFLVTFFSNSI